MKSLLSTILVYASAMLILFGNVSCDHDSDNGELDGMWQFMSITYNRDGLYDSTVNVKSNKAYLSFQLDLAKISWLNLSLSDNNIVLCRFNHQSKQLRLHNFYLNYPDHDDPITDSETTLLTPLGILGNDVNFDVIQLNSTTMILQSSYARITLRKF